MIVERISGLETGILIREMKPDYCTVSIRSYRKEINSAETCSQFGGFCLQTGPVLNLTESMQWLFPLHKRR